MPSSPLLFAISGECDVYKGDNRVNILRNGTVFGEAGIKADDAVRSATIVCFTACVMLTLQVRPRFCYVVSLTSFNAKKAVLQSSVSPHGVMLTLQVRNENKICICSCSSMRLSNL